MPFSIIFQYQKTNQLAISLWRTQSSDVKLQLIIPWLLNYGVLVKGQKLPQKWDSPITAKKSMRVYQFVVYHIHRSWRFCQGSPRGCPVTTELPVQQCSPLTRWLSSPSVSVGAIKAFCFLKRLGDNCDNMMLNGIQVGIYWLSNLFCFERIRTQLLQYRESAANRGNGARTGWWPTRA